MIELLLKRDVGNGNECAGWLTTNGRKWATIERPWLPSSETPAGRKGVSCLPPGEYRLEPHDSEAHPKVWALINRDLDVYHWPWEVPVGKRSFARTVCLIHPANWAYELRGCIAPGRRRAIENGRWRTYESRDAVNELRSVLGTTAVDAHLTIEGPNG